jgi:hypothetical protein
MAEVTQIVVRTGEATVGKKLLPQLLVKAIIIIDTAVGHLLLQLRDIPILFQR